MAISASDMLVRDAESHELRPLIPIPMHRRAAAEKATPSFVEASLVSNPPIERPLIDGLFSAACLHR